MCSKDRDRQKKDMQGRAKARPMAHLADESWTTPRSVKQDTQASHDMTMKLGSLGKNSGTARPCAWLPGCLAVPVSDALVSHCMPTSSPVSLAAIYAGANWGHHDHDTYQDDDRDD